MNKILKSWQQNAKEWSRVIDAEEIASRKFTNKAIVDTLLSLNVKKVLDVGCGEGWLTRELSKNGIESIGIDATQELISIAKSKSEHNFYQLTYEEIIASKEIPNAPFDLVVFNFSIYNKDGLVELLSKLKNKLTPKGKIVIQTLHPFFLLSNNLEYKSQWIDDSWKGLKGNFVNGHSWYARTLEEWICTFKKSDLNLLEIKEVNNSELSPISIIFVLQTAFL